MDLITKAKEQIILGPFLFLIDACMFPGLYCQHTHEMVGEH